MQTSYECLVTTIVMWKNLFQSFQYWFEKITHFLRWNGSAPSIVVIMLLNVMADPIIWSIAFPSFCWQAWWDRWIRSNTNCNRNQLWRFSIMVTKLLKFIKIFWKYMAFVTIIIYDNSTKTYSIKYIYNITSISNEQSFVT